MKPIQLLPRGIDGQLTFNEEGLRIPLSGGNVKNRKLVIVSAVGVFRKGKSFILNYILRYLKYKRQGVWFDDENAPLEGFEWRGGEDVVTEGILLWPQAFLIDDSLAVLVLDTQGAFDPNTNTKDRFLIFSLSSLLSSLLILNIQSQIDLHSLQDLSFILEYGKMVQDNNTGNSKPFQDLVILVRDWSHHIKTPFGFDGGDDYLNRWFQKSGNEDRLTATANISQCFSRIRCFLMPFPGERIWSGHDVTGAIAECSLQFKPHLQTFVETLLGSGTLPIKRISAIPILAKDYADYCSAYFERLNFEDAPLPASILECNEFIYYMKLVEKSYVIYENKLEEDGVEFTEMIHETSQSAALGHFDRAPNLCTNDTTRLHNRRSLVLRINETHLSKKTEISAKITTEKLSKCYDLYFNYMKKEMCKNALSHFPPQEDFWRKRHEDFLSCAKNVYRQSTKECLADDIFDGLISLEMNIIELWDKIDVEIEKANISPFALLDIVTLLTNTMKKTYFQIKNWEKFATDTFQLTCFENNRYLLNICTKGKIVFSFLPRNPGETMATSA